MNSLLIILVTSIGYIIAYSTYGKLVAHKLFKLSSDNKMPAHKYRDDIDFVPTKKHIIFGHHFTTIAGLGPIVGPTIGVIWGWLPALLWVFFGSIFMGAVHDFTILVISARNDGKTIGDLTGNIIGPSTRMAFQVLIQFLLLIVLSVFAMIVGVLFNMYPEAVFPVWMQIPIAIWLGWKIRQGKNDFIYSIIAVLLMYATVVAGIYLPITLPPVMGSSVVTWCLLLFVYVYFASTIPVQILLQPRDYINSHQLILAMILLVAGVIVAHPILTAPAINYEATAPGSDIPSLFPLLFITIACGAISGFHSLASSGTTVKQVDKEKDTLFIGYGGMIWESFLAVLVIIAVAGGLGLGLEEDGTLLKGMEAFRHHYASWATATTGLDAKLEAFIVGASNLFASIGIPASFGKAIIAVFIVSFANTTLDSATRIQRLSFQEMCKNKSGEIAKPFKNRFFATFIVVLAAIILTFLKPGGQGAMKLWPLFGSLNQLLAALALGIASLYFYKKRKSILYTLLPMIFILLVTGYSMVVNIFTYIFEPDYTLLVISILILLLTLWLLVGGVKAAVVFGNITKEKK